LDVELDYTTVTYSKKTKPTKPSYSAMASSNVSGGPSNQPKPNLASAPSVKRRTVLGDSLTSGLKASKTPQIKKAVYRISNVDEIYSANDVFDHITSLNIRVVTCFELKKTTWQKEGNKSF